LDALTSDRAYRPAWEAERAIEHIAAGAGSLFDPLCVEAFLDVITGSGSFSTSRSPDVEAVFRESLERHRPPGRASRRRAASVRRVVAPGS
jgi:HD-GYP domain-containing protein (c-di-GMP phosphodiesterase class II)